MKDNDDVLNIKSVQLSCDFGWKRKSDLSLTRHLVRVSSSDDREFVWLHIQSFHVCLVESVLIIRREPHPPALQKQNTHTHATYFKSLKLYIDIFIFLNEKKKEKTVGFEMLGRRTVPARLRGHDGIYSVKFPTHCSHQSTHTQMPKHTSYSALDPPPTQYPSTLPGSELDRVAASWLSAGVKLQYLNKKYADWNVWNNTQLSRHFRQMEAFGDGALTASHPPTLQ